MSTDSPLPTVVLVHGMWHGGWAWERVAALLEASGHRCVRVTLPGEGRAPGDPTFRGHCDHLLGVLAGVAGDVVLVGHSYSGALLGEVGDAPNVRAMVFVSAFCLEPGESVGSVNDAEAGSQAGRDDIRRVGDTLVIDPDTARHAFYHDCTPEDAYAAAERLTPEHAGVRDTSVTRAAWRDVPSHFVVCTLDRACTPDVQRMMAARLKSVSELESSHSPMLSMPHAVADAITEFAARTGAAA
ncbi:alpha/beta hydrolase [Pseudonocardia zijingensis]|jgi:pimeloyl-ACP methyl ester carboxylesterase|uniref:Alpha/beta hydrolase n=1 Tax=Pseudonocardia zijingensis TaxID=153376 RepID=A0ABN1N721_9PSEU